MKLLTIPTSLTYVTTELEGTMINFKLVLLVNKLERLWTAIQIGDISAMQTKDSKKD